MKSPDVIAPRRSGGWIVNNPLGLVGGIFISESVAHHFAFEEIDWHPEEMALAEIDADLYLLVPKAT